MEIAVKPIKKGGMDATISCPRSRSYTNRALLIAALAEGKSTLKNALHSEDTEHMTKSLQQMGIEIEEKEKSGEMKVTGKGGTLKLAAKKLYTGNSGTTMRFLTAAATLAEGKTVIDGDARMSQRPIGDLAEALKQLGAEVRTNNGFPPVTIKGEGLKGGKAIMNGALSSQYLSAILMVAPYADNNVEIEIKGELTSKPYADMTTSMMKEFGVKAKNSSYKEFEVKAGQKYAARNYFIEGDCSNASYFFAAAAVTKGRVKVTGINPKSVQGDAKFPDALQRMGCKVEKGEDWINVEGNELKGIDIDMNSMPDTAQTLAVVAAFAKGKTRIRSISNLRIKETDRIKATAAELRKIGAKAKETEDELEIIPGKLKAATIETYNDHRMAMSFAIAGLAIPGIRIKGAECAAKSFPNFFEELQKLSGQK